MMAGAGDFTVPMPTFVGDHFFTTSDGFGWWEVTKVVEKHDGRAFVEAMPVPPGVPLPFYDGPYESPSTLRLMWTMRVIPRLMWVVIVSYLAVLCVLAWRTA